jgi:hypothetical protein
MKIFLINKERTILNKLFLLFVSLGSLITAQGQSEIVFESTSFQPIVNESFKEGKITAEVKLTCEIMDDPPHDCYTAIYFLDKKLPALLYHGEVKGISMSDLNADGIVECVLLVDHMGNWDSIAIMSLAKSTKTKKSLWYEPIQSFMWYTGHEGDKNCEARILFNPKSNKLEIQTSRLTDRDVDCSEHLFPIWKKLNVN